MKIYPLVNLRAELLNYINQCRLDTSIEESILQGILHTTSKNTTFEGKFSTVELQYQQLHQQHQQIVAQLTSIVKEVEQEIRNTLTHHTLQKELELTTEVSADIYPDSIISDKIYVQIHSLLQKYMDWHYPGLVINARFKKWIDCLIPTDPLYLTLAQTNTYTKAIEDMPKGSEEANQDYINRPGSQYYLTIEKVISDELRTVTNSYSDLYRKRLRLYPILGQNFSQLPKNQFGIILAMESFNYFNHLELKRYLTECFSLLRPGGVLVFNFWDCDIPNIAEKFDEKAIPYCSKTYINDLVAELGYASANFVQYDNDEVLTVLSLAEIKKPGRLTTSKHNQSVGKLIEK